MIRNLLVLKVSLCYTRAILLQAIAHRDKVQLQRSLFTWKEESILAKHRELTRNASKDFEGLNKDYEEISRQV